MYYYIDGYNLIFSAPVEGKSLLHQRQQVIRFLQKQFATHHLSGMVVFDGAHKREEESGRGYRSPLEIAYAPKGESADRYIIEQIEKEKTRGQVTVVTNDKGLILHARSAGAKVQSNDAFIRFLKKKSTHKKVAGKREVSETPYHIDRYLKIFEKKLEEE